MTQTDGKIYHVHGLEELIFVKMTVLPKAVYRFSAIPIKVQKAYLELGEIISKQYRNKIDPEQTNNLEKEEQRWSNQTS